MCKVVRKYTVVFPRLCTWSQLKCTMCKIICMYAMHLEDTCARGAAAITTFTPRDRSHLLVEG